MTALELSAVIPVENASSGKSSLLIPDLQLGYFQKQCDRHGGRAAYLQLMVQRYLPHLDLIHNAIYFRRERNWNTIFQDSGKDLIKKSFYPSGSDWELLRNAAGFCGVSMCFLFVFLMGLEMEGFFENLTDFSPVERSSSPQRNSRSKKFAKFSIFTRKIDIRRQKLQRKYRCS